MMPGTETEAVTRAEPVARCASGGGPAGGAAGGAAGELGESWCHSEPGSVAVTGGTAGFHSVVDGGSLGASSTAKAAQLPAAVGGSGSESREGDSCRDS